MDEIEWDENRTVIPAERSLQSFCREKGLPQPGADSHEPLVFISAAALEGLNQYLSSDLAREHGGVLVGAPYTDPERGCLFIDVCAAIPALDSGGSAVHLQFTAAAWQHITGLLEESYPDKIVVGWFHSHPGLGVFMSGTDQASQRAFYPHPWSLALVVDPIERHSGWFNGAESTPLRRSQIQIYPALEPMEKKSRQPFQEIAWFLPLFLFSLAALGLLGYIKSCRS